MATVVCDYALFKAAVGKIAGVLVYYATMKGVDDFRAIGVGGPANIFYSGSAPATWATDFPLATQVSDIYV